MFRAILLTSAVTLLSSCALFQKPEVITEYKFIERPPLNIEVPNRPNLLNETDFSLYSDGKVCTSPEQLRSHLSDLSDIQKYLNSLEIYIFTMKSHYENKTKTENNSPNQ